MNRTIHAGANGPPARPGATSGPTTRSGRLNLLTPDKVKQGIAEVKDGLSFCLSLPLNYPGEAKLNPRRKPPQLKPTQPARQAVPELSRSASSTRATPT